MTKRKPTIVFDFDGVVHSYCSGWKGVGIIPDPPVQGIGDTIQELREDYKVIIVSTRTATPEGHMAVLEWLNKWGITVDGVSDVKPPAMVYVDDRAICFNGKTEGLVDQIKGFKNWLGK